MRYLLSRTCRPILSGLAAARTLCAFDFDGTLAPIVGHAKQAAMRPRTRELLGRLAALYPCVVISGRARADVLGKLEGVNLAGVLGNHGAESEAVSDGHGAAQGWSMLLERELGALPGVWIENKGSSISVHYRQSIQKAAAKLAIRAAVDTLQGVRTFGGKYVVNVVTEQAPHKGDALLAERNRLGCDRALYVGDDENDEDAFALTCDMVSVRIGHKKRTHARYYLRKQSEIDRLMEFLIAYR